MRSGTGAGLFLIALGAILAFAVTARVGVVNLTAVGWILMLVGALGLVMDLVLYAPRQRRDSYSGRDYYNY